MNDEVIIRHASPTTKREWAMRDARDEAERRLRKHGWSFLAGSAQGSWFVRDIGKCRTVLLLSYPSGAIYVDRRFKGR
jgi:hypothetical protein